MHTLNGPEDVVDALTDLIKVCSDTGEDFDALLDRAMSAPMRYALVSANAGQTDQIAAYMPGNYKVIGRTPIKGTNVVSVLIAGRDVAGWTLDDYVLPRLASGMYYGDEIGGV